MTRQIVLLRGINLGPSRRVAMADLRELLAGLGFAGVRTYLQSGNALLDTDLSPEKLSGQLEAELASRFGFDVPVIVRTRDELAEVVRRNPLGDVAADPKRYQVSFLSAEPEAERVQRIAALDLAPERFAHAGREVYAWHPDGIQRSPLARLLSDRQLGVTATARNWRTVTELLALADA